MNINHLKRDIIQATQAQFTGHVPSALSVLDIIYVLYHNVMQPGDRFVLSKGHAALALYAVLADIGTIARDDLMGFATRDSKLGGHPDRTQAPVEFSTGSLGHGLPLACGLAMGLRSYFKPGRVYCLIGDGELQEGSTLEAIRLVGRMALPITVILDANDSHHSSYAVNLFMAYGFTTTFCNGHNHDALTDAMTEYCTGPIAVIAKTVKGNGIKRMVDAPGEWHSKAPNAVEAREMIEELAG